MSLGLGLGIGLVNNVAATSGGGATFSTFNPADKSAGMTLSNGNLTATGSAAVVGVRGNTAITGKKYFEFHMDSNASTDGMIGICTASQSLTAFIYTATGDNYVMFYNGDLKNHNGTATATGLGAATTGSTIMFAVDEPNKLIWVGKNGTFFGSPSAGTGGLSFSAISGSFFPVFQTDAADVVTANFGASSYAFTPPSGFSSI